MAVREPEVNLEVGRAHGLTDGEYDKMVSILGRTPTFTELGLFMSMWSEHCSYKSSRIFLKDLPTTGPCVVHGPGENAGVVDIGDGQVAVFKMESHNHPSFVEPYQGAATGVGGILRDVFTMGARPVANLNALRFGPAAHPRTPFLVSGVVSGIGGYGNAVGVPTVGGNVDFDECYAGNILVNAFTLGIAAKDRIFLGQAVGVGNALLYFGSKTGRDGIHGASLLASAEFDASSDEKRPTVQVGDPFTEKLLLEACLELMAVPGLLVGIQDMGAAGLTSSSVEMAARANNGVEIDLNQVPRREPGMTPYEMMLSESQERMLAVVAAGREAEALALLDKWDLERIGNSNGLCTPPRPPARLTAQRGAGAPGLARHRLLKGDSTHISEGILHAQRDERHLRSAHVANEPTHNGVGLATGAARRARRHAVDACALVVGPATGRGGGCAPGAALEIRTRPTTVAPWLRE